MTLALLRPRARATLRGLVSDPWRALCGAVGLRAVVVFAFVPGTLPRYLIPALPAAAVLVAAVLRRVDRPRDVPWLWVGLGVVWLVALPGVARERLSPLPPADAAVLTVPTTLLGLLALGVGRVLARTSGVAFAVLLAAGLLYGLAYGGVAEARTAERYRAFEEAAADLAPLVRPDVPLVVEPGTDRRFTYPLAHRLDRLLVERPPEGPHDIVGAVGPGPPPGRLVRESGGFALWRVAGDR